VLPLQEVHWGSIAVQLTQAPFRSWKPPGQAVQAPLLQAVQFVVIEEHRWHSPPAVTPQSLTHREQVI
jgi:hypothetical protein